MPHCNAQTSFSKGTKDLPQDESKDESQERLLEESETQYNDVLCDLLEKQAPLKTKWLTIRPAAPWVNDYILSAMKERRRMERRWRFDRRPGNLHESKRHCQEDALYCQV